ncbi:MAG: alanine/glycine:cation symporter family protein [Anaerovoracaceae bacterium]
MLEQITGTINGYIWSIPLVILALIVGIFFTVSMKFPQIRLFKDMLHYLTNGKDSEAGISSFQGFAMALGGRIGVGNIAGVATAICFGGPGAVFWMWIIAILGAGSAFAESALSQIYKEKIDGEYRGGPAYYIEKGTGVKSFAVLFAITAVIANGFTGPTIQAFNVAEAAHNAFGVSPMVVGVVLAALFALVIFGGMKRIGKVAEIVVPIMAIAYIIIALVILGVNYERVPAMFGLIFSCAFNLNAFYGAIWGSAVMWGVKRGIYSSEAGMGSGAHASASAEVSHPAKQGLAQSFSIYVDTLFVCTATAIMILSTGMYNVFDENTGKFLVEALPGMAAGTGYTQAAIDTLIPGLGSIFIAVAVFFFAFTTLLSFAFYTEANVSYLGKNFKYRKQLIFGLKIVLTAIIMFGAVRSSAVAWNFADIGVGLMSWVNLIALLVLNKPVRKVLKDYERQKHLGLDPVFDPDECGIKNAELWKDIVKEKYSK